MRVVKDQGRYPGGSKSPNDHVLVRCPLKNQISVTLREDDAASSGGTHLTLYTERWRIFSLFWAWPKGNTLARHPMSCTPFPILAPFSARNPLPRTEVMAISPSKPARWLCQGLGISSFPLICRR